MKLFWTLLCGQWDRTLASLSATVGVGLIVGAYEGASHALLPSQQLPYAISGGLGGLFALGLGATLWLSADIRDEWRALERLHDDLTRSTRLPDLDADGRVLTPDAISDSVSLRPAGVPALLVPIAARTGADPDPLDTPTQPRGRSRPAPRPVA